MRLSPFTVSALVAMAEASSISSTKTTTSTSSVYTGPARVSNTASAISAVESYMSAQSPHPSEASTATVRVTASKVSTTSVKVESTLKTHTTSKGHATSTGHTTLKGHTTYETHTTSKAHTTVKSGLKARGDGSTTPSTTPSSSNALGTATTGVGNDGITTVAYPPVCTAINLNTYAVVDPQGVAFNYMCGGGSQGSPYGTISATSSKGWSDCFALCDASAGCTGFSYVNGVALGAGVGQCWLKNASPQSFASTGNLLTNRIAAYVRSTISTTSTTSLPTTTASTTSAGCSAAAAAFTYTPSLNTLQGFLADTVMTTNASNAASPAGYTWTFASFYGSIEQPGYQWSLALGSYDTNSCAAACNATASCAAFNIYYERDPASMSNSAASCVASPQVGIRCAFYSTPVNSTNTVNVGEWRGSFGVVITGSNGYNKN